MNDGFAWGGGPDLGAWETVMWRAYDDPHTRSMGTFIELLDTEPDWDRLVNAHVRGSLQVPRLRERIIEPAVLVGTPAWSPDPNWDVEHHVHRVRLPEPGTMAQLYQTVADIHERPLDRARAPWEATLVTGLEDGRAAYLFKSHHVLGDGLAIVQLLELLHSHSREPGPRQVPKPPVRARVTPYTLAARRIAELATGTPVQLARRLPRLPLRLLGNPVSTTTDAVGYLRSFQRQSAPPQTPRSPLLRGKSGLGIRVLTVDVPLASLRAAGKAAGGSINDAYLAGILGGLRRYHEHAGVEVREIPITIPVSTRTAANATGGNQFSAVRLVGPLGERDAARRVRALRAQVSRARNEPAIGWLDTASKLLDKLPAPALIELVYQGAAKADAQISSFPGMSWEAYVAGAKVTGIYVVGPRPGIAMMSTMLSYEGTACIGFNLDPDAFSDIDVLHRCLLEGFEEVFALAGPEVPQVVESPQSPESPEPPESPGSTGSPGAQGEPSDSSVAAAPDQDGAGS